MKKQISEFLLASVLALLISTFARADLINSGFELPAKAPGNWYTVNAANTPGFGWNTTSPDGLVEIWANPYGLVTPDEGNQFAELNGWYVSSLYQDVSDIEKDAIVGWSFAHRGRLGVDTIRLTITDLVANSILFTQDFATGQAWTTYSGGGLVASGNPYRFEWTSVSAAGGNQTYGNFLDDAHFGVGFGQVPEPATMLLFGTGITVLAGLRMRRKK